MTSKRFAKHLPRVYSFDASETLKRVREAERSYLAGKARELRSWNELD